MTGYNLKKSTDFVLSWKSKEVSNSKLKPSYTSFLYSMKFFGYKMGIKFDEALLVVEQNNNLNKIANVYIVYD